MLLPTSEGRISWKLIFGRCDGERGGGGGEGGAWGQPLGTT